jgi:beta-glucosidase
VQSIDSPFPNLLGDQRALSYWDTVAATWRVAAGCYRVMVGGSSRDLALQGALGVDGVTCR